MDTNLKNILILAAVMLVLALCWSIWEINRGQSLLDSYTSVGESFARGERDAVLEYTSGFYNFHLEKNNTGGWIAPGISKSQLDAEFSDFKGIGRGGYICHFDANVDPYHARDHGLHLEKYHSNRVYITAYNTKLASLIREHGRENNTLLEYTKKPKKSDYSPVEPPLTSHSTNARMACWTRNKLLACV